MKKVTRLLTITTLFGILLFSMSNILKSQSFELVSAESVVNEPNQYIEDVESKFDFRNISDESKEVDFSVIIESITPGHTVAVCTFICYPYVSTTTHYDNFTLDLNPGKSASDLLYYLPSAHCNPNGNEGTTKVIYSFYDRNNPEDKIDIPITFNFGSVSINDINPNEFIVAYPNPTNGVLSIYSEVINIQDIKIYSINGNEVYSMNNVANNYKTLDLSSLAKGSYVMMIFMEDGTRKSQQLVIE